MRINICVKAKARKAPYVLKKSKASVVVRSMLAQAQRESIAENAALFMNNNVGKKQEGRCYDREKSEEA